MLKLLAARLPPSLVPRSRVALDAWFLPNSQTAWEAAARFCIRPRDGADPVYCAFTASPESADELCEILAEKARSEGNPPLGAVVFRVKEKDKETSSKGARKEKSDDVLDKDERKQVASGAEQLERRDEVSPDDGCGSGQRPSLKLCVRVSGGESADLLAQFRGLDDSGCMLLTEELFQKLRVEYDEKYGQL